MASAFNDMISARRRRCDEIARSARSAGLDVNWRRVNRNMALFERWYSHRISTGYLIRETGIRRLKRPIVPIRGRSVHDDPDNA